MSEVLFWLFMTLFWTGAMSFFSAEEMACISYNKLQLEVEASFGNKRAKWLKDLLKKPTSLFGTTLIGVNFCLVLSSECMRQFFSSLAISPNLSPILQVPYVLLFGELVPMFTARLFPEYTARFGSPILKITSLLITPFAYLSEKLFQTVLRPFIKKQDEEKIALFHHEELKDLLCSSSHSKKEDENPISSLFLTLQKMKERKTGSAMTPVDTLPRFYEKRDASFALDKLHEEKQEIGLLCNKQKGIIGYVTEEMLLAAVPTELLKNLIHSTTFVSEEMKLLDTLFRMREEGTLYSFVINKQGEIVGVVSLYTLLLELIPSLPLGAKPSTLHISKTIPADMTIADFCTKYDLSLPHTPGDTFLDLMEKSLDHKPKEGEKLFLGPLEITVKETNLLGPKTLFVHSR